METNRLRETLWKQGANPFLDFDKAQEFENNEFILSSELICAIGYGVSGFCSARINGGKLWSFKDYSLTAVSLIGFISFSLSLWSLKLVNYLNFKPEDHYLLFNAINFLMTNPNLFLRTFLLLEWVENICCLHQAWSLTGRFVTHIDRIYRFIFDISSQFKPHFLS